MPYSSFTMREIQDTFGVRQIAKPTVFDKVLPRAVGNRLKEELTENLDLALPAGTEKARSEFIIAPVLTELRRQTDKRISLFSGTEFNVDAERGLNGRCDFLISRTPYQILIESPIVVAVEAKQDDFSGGMVQCIAEMIAARIFNEQQGNPVSKLYGVVTNGQLWQFAVLDGENAIVEVNFYEIEEIEMIMGVLWAMTFDTVQF